MNTHSNEELVGFLTVADVSKWLRIRKLGIYELIKSGKLPAVRIGHRLRVNPADVRAFLSSSVVGGRAPSPAACGDPRTGVRIGQGRANG